LLSHLVGTVADVPRLRTVHRCTECGNASPRWSGRCSACGAWNTLVEEVDEVRPAATAAALASPTDTPVPLGEVDLGEWAPVPTGLDELDRVLGGGLVPGSVTLVGGEPGIGKSTLLLQALASLATQQQARCLLVTAEESKQQVRLRAERPTPPPPACGWWPRRTSRRSSPPSSR
jgi:DNA repair protein RadA/Sms